MKRRTCLSMLGAGLCAAGASAAPTAAEQARIDQLITAVGKRTEVKFIRNGKEYDSAYAAEFLRGKLKWRSDKVNTVQEFIEQIGTRSTTSGEVYTVRLADGQIVPSAEFLRMELKRLDTR